MWVQVTADDRFADAEHALDVAREDRAQARRDRYAARQAHERASATADRLARRVRELSERLDRAAELTDAHATAAGRGAPSCAGGCDSDLMAHHVNADYYADFLIQGHPPARRYQARW